MEDTDFYGVYIVDAYDLGVEELYEIIKKNTNYVKNIKKGDIKDIKVTYYKEIIILLKDGRVYLDGEEVYKNVNKILFMSGTSILGITNEKQIISIAGSDNNTRFMSNNGYKYKKIFYNPLVLVALNNDREVKLYGCTLDFAINYKNYYDVDDIAYIEEEDDVVVLKGDKIISLLHNTEYYDVELVLSGEGKDYQIL